MSKNAISYLIKPEDPAESDDDVAAEEQQQEEPVELEQPLVQSKRGQAAEHLDGAALRDQGQVGVQKGGVVQVADSGDEGASRIHQGVSGDAREANNAGQQRYIAGVDPKAVVAHSPL